uniref:Macaca fascicularis brain cDNA clone: QtrA-18132, similar to human FK506 binding protein 14, 22 kDa (FKBP14), mRNA, RefSeq: NM_017946.1 n=1 Tax=Macaca fascicularis TaxID=9541 RepID=I7GPL5_MACFA|nr:unnamed protein product [Macaca fascicularis]
MWYRTCLRVVKHLGAWILPSEIFAVLRGNQQCDFQLL